MDEEKGARFGVSVGVLAGEDDEVVVGLDVANTDGLVETESGACDDTDETSEGLAEEVPCVAVVERCSADSLLDDGVRGLLRSDCKSSIEDECLGMVGSDRDFGWP